MASAYSLAVAGSAEVLASVEAVQALAEAAGLVAADSEVSVAAAEALVSVVVPYQVKAYPVRMSKSLQLGTNAKLGLVNNEPNYTYRNDVPCSTPRFLHCKNGEHSACRARPLSNKTIGPPRTRIPEKRAPMRTTSSPAIWRRRSPGNSDGEKKAPDTQGKPATTAGQEAALDRLLVPIGRIDTQVELAPPPLPRGRL